MVLTVVFPLLGWLIAGACVATGAASLARAVPLGKGRRLRPGRKGVKPGTVLLLWSCLSVACLTGLGVIGLGAGVFASVVLAVITIVALRASPGRRAHLAAGPAHLGHDVALLASRGWHAVREQAAASRSVPDATPAPAPGPAPAAAAGGARTVPSPLAEDPALAPVPPPEEVIEGVVVPAWWAEVASVIAGFVPEDDVAQSQFLTGIAAGAVRVAQALAAHADALVNDVGVDPAYAAAILEVADRFAELASWIALADRRYHTIYEAVKDFVDAGGILPHNARQFFGGSGNGSPPAGGSEAA